MQFIVSKIEEKTPAEIKSQEAIRLNGLFMDNRIINVHRPFNKWQEKFNGRKLDRKFTQRIRLMTHRLHFMVCHWIIGYIWSWTDDGEASRQDELATRMIHRGLTTVYLERIVSYALYYERSLGELDYVIFNLKNRRQVCTRHAEISILSVNCIVVNVGVFYSILRCSNKLIQKILRM